jgi:hypothetical protein
MPERGVRNATAHPWGCRALEAIRDSTQGATRGAAAHNTHLDFVRSSRRGRRSADAGRIAELLRVLYGSCGISGLLAWAARSPTETRDVAPRHSSARSISTQIRTCRADRPSRPASLRRVEGGYVARHTCREAHLRAQRLSPKTTAVHDVPPIRGRRLGRAGAASGRAPGTRCQPIRVPVVDNGYGHPTRTSCPRSM